MKGRQYEMGVDAALVGIAASLGVPVKELFEQTEKDMDAPREQGIGEFCGNAYLAQCTADLGERALPLACRTCPN